MAKTKLFIEAVPLVDKQMSGIPHALANLVAALAVDSTIKKHFEIVLVIPKGRASLLSRWHGLESCTRKTLPMKFRIMNGLARRSLLPPMDLILGSGIYLFGNYFSWPLTRYSRSLTWIHDMCFALHPDLVQPQNQRMLAKNTSRFIKQTDYVVTVSESSRQDIINYYRIDSQKVIVAYNGVRSDFYRQLPHKAVMPVISKYNLEYKKYFLFVSNIEPRKNVQRLVEAIALLPKEYCLMLVGSDGWLNDDIFRTIKDLNSNSRRIVKPLAFVTDEEVVALLNGAVALVQPSIYEGFSISPLEALSVGTPVVVSDTKVFHEVVGGAGIYCNPTDIDSIVQALNQTLHLPLSEKKIITRIGRKQVQKFSWQKTATKLAALLVDIDTHHLS